jgi:hypothetical protein
LIEDPQLIASPFDEHPGGFGAAAFNAQDAFAGFHDKQCLAGFLEDEKVDRVESLAVASYPLQL